MWRTRAVWQTRFGSFVQRHGAARLARDLGPRLGYTPARQTVSKWIYARHFPPPAAMDAMITISGGELDWNAFGEHRLEVLRLPDPRQT